MLRAGVAKVCISPPIGTWQGGYAERSRPSEGIHDNLYARALVLEGQDIQGNASRVAIVSLDLVHLLHEQSEAIRRRAEDTTGIPAGNITLCASHTHGGPVMYDRIGTALQADDEYIRVLEKTVAGAIAAAARDLGPAQLSFGRGTCDFNVNRRRRGPTGRVSAGPNPDGPVDREVLVLSVDRLDTPQEAPLAVVFRYTCHAASMMAENYLITADYPGAAAAFVERAYGGETLALFLQGCAGDIRPYLVNARGGFRGSNWRELAALGSELGGTTLAVAERSRAQTTLENLPDARPPLDELASDASDPTGTPLGAARATVLLPFDTPPTEEELQTLLEAGCWPEGAPLSKPDEHWAKRTLEGVRAGTLKQGNTAEVQVIRLGQYWLVALPGEVFVEIGWRVRDAVASAAGISAQNILVTAYANGHVGYVPTADAIRLGGYEPTAYRRQGWPACYVPEAGQILTDTAGSLATQLV